MKIVISQQQDKKLTVEFYYGKLVEKYRVDKAEDFLVCIDKFLRKRIIADRRGLLRGFTQKNLTLKFENTGVLTERIIRAIMLGFRFSYFKQN
ncbi:MAG: hypothetical protein Q8N61_02000 [bacterium]|nr:hypothetical protein [bacterium]